MKVSSACAFPRSYYERNAALLKESVWLNETNNEYIFKNNNEIKYITK